MPFFRRQPRPPEIDRMQKQRDVEGLMKVLSGREPPMKRAYAADALGEIGDGRAVEPLLMAIKDGNDDLVREHSVTALGKICDPRAVEPLIELLKSGDYFFIRKPPG